MDEELKALLEATEEEDFDWKNLLLALQHRGYPSGKDGLKAIRARLKNFLKAMQSETRTLLIAESKRVFEEHPKLESFAWHQYTPYWIDGEACSFSSNMGYPSINGKDWYDSSNDPDLAKATMAVKEMLNPFDNSYILFQLFGDHKTVKVTREGIFLETYEHQ